MKIAVRFLAIVLAVFLAISAVPGFAQNASSVSGGLSGAVTDPSGAVVPGANVTLVGPQGSTTLTTAENGQYLATGLTPGVYTVTVVKPGFQKVSSKNVQVVVNMNSTLNFKLPVGDVSTTVEVIAPRLRRSIRSRRRSPPT